MASRKLSLRYEHTLSSDASYDLTEVTQAAAKSQETMMQPWAMYLFLLSHINCTSLKSTKR